MTLRLVKHLLRGRRLCLRLHLCLTPPWLHQALPGLALGLAVALHVQTVAMLVMCLSSRDDRVWVSGEGGGCGGIRCCKLYFLPFDG